MKQPFRVAFVGPADARVCALVAGLSPSLQPRTFADWALVDPSFGAELFAVLPGTVDSPSPLKVPTVRVCLEDEDTPASLEAQLWGARSLPPGPDHRLLGVSPAIARVRGLLATAAKTGLPVLLTGENGTGKDLAALVTHELSARSTAPFVAVNCGAVPAGLAETEFFGCVRGAFTGAENRTGFCQQAMGGTLFLDEVGEMPLELQAKLLRVLENREVRRVGSSRIESVDFRLVCATNRDLAAEVQAGRFREDLYYRINVLSIKMPPLRERLEDIPQLVARFLDTEELARPAPVRLSPRGLAKLSDYHWPGNLRQLRNVVLRAAVFHSGAELGEEAFEFETL